MSDTPYPSGRYEINLMTIFATRVHETGNPDEPYWAEQIRDRLKYRVAILNVADQTRAVVESPEFGENKADQFAAYNALRDCISQVITANFLTKDQCPQYRLTDEGTLELVTL
jgi:hypothetical protein